MNEFMFKWGSSATLFFAAISTLGIATLGIANIWNRDEEDMK